MDSRLHNGIRTNSSHQKILRRTTMEGLSRNPNEGAQNQCQGKSKTKLTQQSLYHCTSAEEWLIQKRSDNDKDHTTTELRNGNETLVRREEQGCLELS